VGGGWGRGLHQFKGPVTESESSRSHSTAADAGGAGCGICSSRGLVRRPWLPSGAAAATLAW
jgi:hypothetical protein